MALGSERGHPAIRCPYLVRKEAGCCQRQGWRPPQLYAEACKTPLSALPPVFTRNLCAQSKSSGSLRHHAGGNQMRFPEACQARWY